MNCTSNEITKYEENLILIPNELLTDINADCLMTKALVTEKFEYLDNIPSALLKEELNKDICIKDCNMYL